MGYLIREGLEERSVGGYCHADYADGGLDYGPDCYFEGEECEVFFWIAEVVDIDYADYDGEAGAAVLLVLSWIAS